MTLTTIDVRRAAFGTVPFRGKADPGRRIDAPGHDMDDALLARLCPRGPTPPPAIGRRQAA